MSKRGSEGTGVTELQQRAINLFTFLREVVALRSKIVRSLDNYEQVVWLADIPREPECHCVAWNPAAESDSQTWLEVRKPRLHPPPIPPEQLKPWVNLNKLKDSFQEPRIYERIAAKTQDEEDTWNSAEDEPASNNGPAFVSLEEQPEIRNLWDDYVAKKWRPWAEADRPKKSVQQIYTDLFSMYQQQKELGEAYEVVLGLGQLSWTVTSGQEVNRHLIIAQTDLEFDPSRGLITVGPSTDGAMPRLEQDMLEPTERPPANIQLGIEELLVTIEDDVWQSEGLTAALNSWVNSAAEGRGAYEADLEPLKQAERIPRVRLAPALILRRRTQRGMLRFYNQILEKLGNEKDIPSGLIPLVEVGWQDRRTPLRDEARHADVPQTEVADLFFPLPSNAEQEEIVHRLARQKGVLVQGPPGTGKSHTIANLVSHLLATGKRVLVTSQTPRALRVLRDKIPSEITGLCVILLGHDRASFKTLEDSVHSITEKLNSWDARIESREIGRLANELDELRRRAADIEAGLRSLREADSRRHPPIAGRYSGTLQSIGQRLKEEEAALGWISDFVLEETELGEEPPLSNDEALALLELLRHFNEDKELELRQEMPSEESVLDVAGLEELIQAEQAADRNYRAALRKLREDDVPDLDVETTSLSELLSALEDVASQRQEIEKHVLPFVRQLAADVCAEQDQPWRALLEQTKARIQAIEVYPEHIVDLTVTGCDEVDLATLREDANNLLTHLEAGGRVKRWFRYTPQVRERLYLVTDVKVGGKPCKSIETAKNLAAWADLRFHFRKLQGIWSGTMEPPAGDLTRQLAAYKDYCEPIESAIDLHITIQHAAGLSVKAKELALPTWHDVDDICRFRNQVQAVLAKRELESRRDVIERSLVDLRAVTRNLSAHPVVLQLAGAISDRDVGEYQAAYTKLEKLWKDRHRLSQRNALLSRFCCGAPALAQGIEYSPSDESWHDRLQNLRQSWHWLRADRWLQQQMDPSYLQRLIRERQDIQDRIGLKIAKLAAAKAWAHCMERMSSEQETYLKAWMQAIRKIGPSKSKRATRFGRVARENLEKCRSAIPAWIMPIHRVVESVTPGENVFDVAIIDEASQSGVEALFLQYLARQVVVVGDDKQIAPDHVGLNRDDVEALRRRHIPDIPLTDFFDLENSFFDQAVLRYGNRIRLREHFRCMPEIIQFSNNLCYQGEPLIPLRQYGEHRLKPIQTTYVSDGYVKGSTRNVVNPAEAERIVDQIETCCQASQYAGKTLGVISLLGKHQARLIETNLLQRIGPEEIEKRRLVCGDAYAFQGDERDIIFLSLVVAPTENRRFATLTSEMYQRRFNVATSRAKDQMWLFHSVTLDELAPRCLRRRLLEYCLEPKLDQDTSSGIDVADLQQSAASSDRPDRPPPPFDSWFEVDVFLRIHRKGYRVLPQYEMAGYRIDLVVAGMKGRICVECDGDEWHGPDRYDSDIARQRQLERCGCRFWRIRGGEFYRSPEDSLTPLWEFLERHGIRPGAESAVVEEDRLLVAAVNEGNGDEEFASALVEARRGVQTEDEVEQEIQVPPPPRTEADDAAAIEEAREPETSELDEEYGTDGKTFSLSTPARQQTLVPSAQIPKWPDPRTATQREVQDALLKIVSAHGPMPCHYAYQIYAQYADIGRLSKPMRRALNRAAAAAVRAGLIEQENEYQTKDQINRIVRIAGSPKVVMRPRGDRTLYDIPPSEIAALMWNITGKSKVVGHYSREIIFRRVLEGYDLIRLTEKAKGVLEVAYQIYWRGGSGTQDTG